MLHPQYQPEASAVLSPDRVYRYLLSRRWGDGSMSMFVCLNPSTADETQDDPTVRRITGFCKAWDDGGFHLVNLFAFRATKPICLLDAADPVGPDNDRWITHVAQNAERIVVAYGNLSNAWLEREADVAELLKARTLYCLGETGRCLPRHPLYLPKDTQLEVYREAQAQAQEVAG